MKLIETETSAQERMNIYKEDINNKNEKIKEINKRLLVALRNKNKQRIDILKIELQIANLDIMKLKAKIKKEQLKKD